MDINLSDRGWLVLSDAWFPGWKAFVRPFGGDESQETELTIHRQRRCVLSTCPSKGSGRCASSTRP
ncbi:MAG: hypothetical protein R2856_23970 [Caldilineaceae bacterium]